MADPPHTFTYIVYQQPRDTSTLYN